MQFTPWHHALDHRQAIRKGGRFTAGHGALVTEPHQHCGGTLEEPNPGYSWMFSNKARTKMQDRSKTFQGSPQHFIQKAWSLLTMIIFGRKQSRLDFDVFFETPCVSSTRSFGLKLPSSQMVSLLWQRVSCHHFALQGLRPKKQRIKSPARRSSKRTKSNS